MLEELNGSVEGIDVRFVSCFIYVLLFQTNNELVCLDLEQTIFGVPLEMSFDNRPGLAQSLNESVHLFFC